MKLDAHPLVVAVALGLLGPSVLEEEDGEEAPIASETSLQVTEAWSPGPPPLAAEFHRVEIEWLAARDS